mgnify:CR=1 FL=1
MGAKLKVTGLLAAGALAGALATMTVTAGARNSLAPLPLEELQQLAASKNMEVCEMWDQSVAKGDADYQEMMV